jgi:tRNA pseudouridine38-40 synthase
VRIALLIEYSGRRFHGSQYQAGVRTVQSELEKALATYWRRPCRAIFSGRTDSGVHATGQVVHFDLDIPEDETIDLWRCCWGLNGIMSDDLSVTAAQIVPDQFHARFKATERQYVYRILNRPQRSALLSGTYFFIPRNLNVPVMTEAALLLSGQHDFSAFRSTNADNSNTVCDISSVKLLQLPEGRLEFWISADHFVYNMVRIIVGTLIEVGLSKRTPESLQNALQKGDRNLTGPTAPPWGLTLNAVQYPEAYKLFDSSILVSCPGERS